MRGEDLPSVEGILTPNPKNGSEIVVFETEAALDRFYGSWEWKIDRVVAIQYAPGAQSSDYHVVIQL